MRAKATRKQALQEGSLAFLSAFLAAFLDSEAFCRGNVGHADIPFQCVDFLLDGQSSYTRPDFPNLTCMSA
jgi:hypothetical protein